MILVDLVRADIQEYLGKKDGELLFNERDLQMHLAHHLIGTEHYDDVDVEYYVPYEELENYVWKNELKLDILVRKGTEFLPVELKYKTKKHSGFFDKKVESGCCELACRHSGSAFSKHLFWFCYDVAYLHELTQ